MPVTILRESHDGLGVYVRYREGRLRVHVGHEPEDDALRDGDCILEADIGPPFDGTMSLTQFCTNFGVTVDGAIPEGTDPEAHLFANLTGQTTIWKVHLSQITIETSRKIVGKAWSAFPNALLVKPIYDRFKLERLELTLISFATYEKIQKNLEEGARGSARADFSEDFPLRGVCHL